MWDEDEELGIKGIENKKVIKHGMEWKIRRKGKIKD